MQPNKSSFSLHSKSNIVLKEQSMNLGLVGWKTFFKPKMQRKQNSSVYNAQGRLKVLKELADALQDQCKLANELNKDIKLDIQLVREQYEGRKLLNLQNQLQSKIKQLKKQIIISKRTDLLKYQSLQNIIDGLSKNQKEIQNKINEIEQRVEGMQNIMGRDGHLLRALLRP